MLGGLDPEDHRKEVEVLQADPNSPLYSVTSFEELGLAEDLLQGVYGMKFNKPSRIQEKALPMLLSTPPRNLIGQSQSGTGKTACFVLAMLGRVDVNLKAVQSLCLSPARELARQSFAVLQMMSKYSKITSLLIIKEAPLPKGVKITDQCIVGTPGAILQAIKKGTLVTKNLKLFVLDEADQMIDAQGLGEQTIRVKKTCPKSVQTVFFSATYKPEVAALAEKLVPNPNKIRLKRDELSVDGIRQLVIDCGNKEGKYTVLSDIYSYLTIGQSIVFVERIDTANELMKKMTAEGHTVSVLHSKLASTGERDRVIDDFRLVKTKVLITTNVLARGIDIDTVTLVINYDMPVTLDGKSDCETYLHRIGRTGRFGRKGVTINFVHDERSRRVVADFEKFFGRTIEPVPVDSIDEDLERILKEST